MRNEKNTNNSFVLLIKFFFYYLSWPFIFIALGFNLLKVRKMWKKTKKASDVFFVTDIHKIVYKIFKKIAYLKNFEVVKVGFENISKKQMLFLPNHKANCDPVCVFIALYESGYCNPLSIIAKKELSRFKSIRNVMGLLNGIFLDRQNGRSILQCYHRENELIKKNYSILVFPEGTRVIGHNFAKDFKPTVLKVAYENLITVAPITIYGSDQKKRKKEGFRHKIIVTLNKPLQPNVFINIKPTILMNNIKDLIVKKYFETKENFEKKW